MKDLRMYNVLHYFNHFICAFSKFTNHISSISSLVPFEMDTRIFLHNDNFAYQLRLQWMI